MGKRWEGWEKKRDVERDGTGRGRKVALLDNNIKQQLATTL
jgi:hypothetical protein